MVENTVEGLLVKNGVTYSSQGKDFITKCFNPEHEDRNPSFRIDKLSGIAHCFSCGFKLNLFKHYGILTVGNSVRVAKLKQKLSDLKDTLVGIAPPDGLEAYEKEYRGISVETLRYFGACYTNKLEMLENRILFPIKNINGKVMVYVGRHLMSNHGTRYVNYPEGVSMPLYPPALKVQGPTSLVLVEGIMDLLNLWDKGLTNVATCFGTNTMKNTAATKLLPYKAQGVTKIFIMFDMDKAGQDAAKEMQPILEHLGFAVEIIKLQEDMDPGDLDQEGVDEIKGYVT